jgi:hypothetical protein
VNVEVLYIKRCPNHQPTTRLVRAALQQEGVPAEVLEIEVRTAEHAQAIGFLGSPSVRINGVDVEGVDVEGTDVEPEAHTTQHFGLGCRTYLDGERRSGMPSAELIRRVIRAVRTVEEQASA